MSFLVIDFGEGGAKVGSTCSKRTAWIRVTMARARKSGFVHDGPMSDGFKSTYWSVLLSETVRKRRGPHSLRSREHLYVWMSINRLFPVGRPR